MNDANHITNQLQTGEAVLIDVRSKLEYKMGHAQGAINVPLQKIGSFKDADKDAQIYVYCASGNRSAMAMDILRQKGFNNVQNIGGVGNWRALGGTITR